MYHVVRWRWARNGALIGLTIALSDLILEWRGQKYLPSWQGEALAFNVSQMLTVILIPALIGMAIGYIRDRRAIQ